MSATVRTETPDAAHPVRVEQGAGVRVRRNLTSVGIHLDTHVKSGLLRMYSGRTDAVNPEEHLIKIAALLLEHQPRCMVINPLSAMVTAARAPGKRRAARISTKSRTNGNQDPQRGP